MSLRDTQGSFAEEESGRGVDRQPEAMRTFQYRTPSLSSDEVLLACAEYAVQHFGLTEESAKKIKVTAVRTETVHHYVLQTFGETREMVISTKFYEGQEIDGPQKGEAPGTWEMQVPVSAPYCVSQTRLAVPHTEILTPCRKCEGSGRSPCERCSTGGTNICSMCHTKGPELFGDEPCLMCRRSTPGGIRLKCERCGGKGTDTCGLCKGNGKMIHHKTLIVNRKLESDEFAKCRYEIPNDCISSAAAAIDITEENQTLHPMTGAPSSKIRSASAKLINHHGKLFHRILQQKHTLRLIPVSEVSYEWKGQPSKLVVYGRDKRVYCKEAPQKWGTCRVM